MSRKNIDTVIFDLGGVLINWDPNTLYKKIFSDDEERKYFLSEVCTPYWNELQDGGRSIAEATSSLIKEHPKYAIEIEAFYGRWTEMLGGSIDGTVEILKQLRDEKKVRLVSLTNWSAETFPIAIERFEFLQWFEGILVSGVEKLKKPDPKIYQLILDRYDIKAENSIFIDDNQRNVLAANELGINGLLFTTPDKFRMDLKDFGVLD